MNLAAVSPSLPTIRTDAARSLTARPETSLPAARSPGEAAFTPDEAASLVTAFGPFAAAAEAAGAHDVFAGFVSQLAERRARGEDVQVVVWDIPGGGGSGATIMTSAELTAALQSDDPESLGSVTMDDGTHYGIRDLLRAALLGEDGPGTGSPATGSDPSAPALSPKEAVAAAVANLLAAARGDGAGSPTPAPDGESRFLWRSGNGVDSPRIGVLTLAARPESARAGSALLDAVA